MFGSKPKVQTVTLAGHSLTADGRHAVLGFERTDGERLMLALPIEQAAWLVQAGTSLAADAHRALGPAAPRPATLPIARWSMVPGDDDTTVLTFHLTGGGELRLVVTPDTVRDEGGVA